MGITYSDCIPDKPKLPLAERYMHRLARHSLDGWKCRNAFATRFSRRASSDTGRDGGLLRPLLLIHLEHHLCENVLSGVDRPEVQLNLLLLVVHWELDTQPYAVLVQEFRLWAR
jgi:hypothetical protein